MAFKVMAHGVGNVYTNRGESQAYQFVRRTCSVRDTFKKKKKKTLHVILQHLNLRVKRAPQRASAVAAHLR